jgi:glutathione S-transferase
VKIERDRPLYDGSQRQLDVLDKQLARGRFVAGEEYTIADMAIWPWYGNVVLGNVYNAAEFLDAGIKTCCAGRRTSATVRPSARTYG